MTEEIEIVGVGRKPPEKPKEKGNYIFPNFLAEVMKRVSIRTQLEAGLMSMTFILVGMLILAIYAMFFTQQTTFMKVMIVLNTIAGFVFLSSYLVTTFQQYRQYLEVMGILSDIKCQEEVKNVEKKEEKTT